MMVSVTPQRSVFYLACDPKCGELKRSSSWYDNTPSEIAFYFSYFFSHLSLSPPTLLFTKRTKRGGENTGGTASRVLGENSAAVVMVDMLKFQNRQTVVEKMNLPNRERFFVPSRDIFAGFFYWITRHL